MPQRRLTAIWSRNVDDPNRAGRLGTIGSIREVMLANYQLQELRLHNVLEKKQARSLASAAWGALATAAAGRLPSPQCVLFRDSRNHRELRDRLKEFAPDVLYCDSVRSFYFLQSLGHTRSRMKIVVDLDDLMSRRMQALRASGAALSLGYLSNHAPSFLRGTLERGWVSKTISAYEQKALEQVEAQIGTWADDIVLVSSIERDLLQERLRRSGAKAQVHAIPPTVEVVRPPLAYTGFSRFCFIGSDALSQNRLTIQRIVEMWRAIQPRAEIHIFGNMREPWPAVKGVIFRGYAQSLHDVYSEGSVLFAPGYLKGGLKTKVAESFAYGCAVVGNQITFEGMQIENYPLLLTSDSDLAEIVREPSRSLPLLQRAAHSGQSYVATALAKPLYEKRWTAILG